jgi:outer membrane protein
LLDVSKVYHWKRYQSLTDKSYSELSQAEQALQYDVVDRYFAVLAERDNKDLIDREIIITKKQLKQVQHQFDKRMVKITDVYELEAKLDDLYAQQIESNTKLDNAKRSLKELTGKPATSLARLREDIQFLPLQGDIKTQVELAKRHNPLIKAQNEAIEAADYNLLSQHARHLPVVELQLQHYNTDTGYQNNQTPVIETKVAAININIPLFSGGSTYHGAREASKQLAIDKQRKISLLRAIEKETYDAYLSANASVRRIKAAEKAHKTAIKAREAMEKGFQYGMQSIGDVLVSQAREFSTHRDLLDAKYSYIKNRIRFEQVSGTLSLDTLEKINRWLIQ